MSALKIFRKNFVRPDAEINAYQRIAGEAIFEIGRRLKHVKENDLAHGCFEEWFTSVGFKKRNVYQLIELYNLVRANLAQSDLLEDLPVSLTYAIAKPSAESTPAKAQSKAEVLAGEITRLFLLVQVIDLTREQLRQNIGLINRDQTMTRFIVRELFNANL